MNNIKLAFLLTTIAGMSTMIGSLFIFFKFKNKEKFIAGSLSFAAGVMMTVSITDLVPESIIYLTKNMPYLAPFISIIFMIIGIILSMIIEHFIPKYETNNNKNISLFRVGIISMLAIIIHNIPEGIATFIATNSNISLGISLTIAIALHNIPEGISISIPIYCSSNNKLKAFLYTFISALSEPFGAIITYLFLARFINNTIMGILFSIIAGIMLHISLCELLPTSKNYNYKKITKIFFVIGIIFMLLKFLI